MPRSGSRRCTSATPRSSVASERCSVTSAGEVDAAVARLAERHRLPEGARGRLIALVEQVAGAPDAPTAIRTPRQIVADHLADSLSALELPVVREARRVLDLGSGAGFPGLPLALALPEASVTLLESSARKSQFMARVAATCGAANARVVTARAESWAEGLGAFDLVTARAVG